MRNPYNNGGVIRKDSGFYNRNELLADCSTLDSGAYYLKGNRRIGKSSYLRSLERIMTANPDVLPVYFSLEGANNTEEIHRFFLEALQNACRHKKLPRYEAPEGFIEALSASVRHFNDQGMHYLLFIDEAENLMKLPGETLTLLHRELINMHDGLTVILSGTNRLQQLYQKTQDGVIFLGNFQTRVIGCFSKEDAKALIRQTKNEGGEVKVSEEVIEQILQYAGTHPFLIQKLCHSLFQYGALREVKPEEDLILDAQLSSFFDIDFEQLDEEHQQVLLQFRWDEGLSADKIKGTPNINMTRAILRELEQLGFLRSENGVYWVGNYFLGLWLGERSSLQDTIPNEYTQPDSTLPSDKNPTLMQKLNVFISYSHKDEDFKEALDTHLTMLKRSDKIAAWNDRAILPGTEWDAEIKHQLEEAHIILLLVSANFIASQYIWKHELARAMERHEQREASIIPIFIKDCDWEGAPFDKLQGLPKDAKPVGKADNDTAWLEVAKGIKAVVTKMEQQLSAPSKENPAPVPPTISHSKNIVSGEITAGGNVHIGDTIVHQHAQAKEATSPAEQTARPDLNAMDAALNKADFASLLALLDNHFSSRPTTQYSTLRQHIEHALLQGMMPNPATVQGLKMLIGQLKKQ
ncbi:MAG TPA: TIR domain-containing protein [Saprospiraceae bacterium]|nr:TIR domain-containing protein [Saprospiraceae bacterium]